jgi:hypothetical protein
MLWAGPSSRKLTPCSGSVAGSHQQAGTSSKAGRSRRARNAAAVASPTRTATAIRACRSRIWSGAKRAAAEAVCGPRRPAQTATPTPAARFCLGRAQPAQVVEKSRPKSTGISRNALECPSLGAKRPGLGPFPAISADISMLFGRP